MNASDETELDRAARHVAEAEAWYIEQSSVLKRMAMLGHETTRAEKLLADFKDTLVSIRLHHQRLLRHRKKRGA